MIVTVVPPAVGPEVGVIEVMAGAASIVSVKFCVATGLIPLVAVMTMGYAPPEPAAGVPDNVAVPFPLSVNVTPVGKAPALLSPGVGNPAELTVNPLGEPKVNVVASELVIDGASFTVKLSGTEFDMVDTSSVTWNTRMG